MLNIASVVVTDDTSHLLIGYKTGAVYEMAITAGKPDGDAQKISNTKLEKVTKFLRPAAGYVVVVYESGVSQKIKIDLNGHAQIPAEDFVFGFTHPQSLVKTSATQVFVGTNNGLKSIA